MNRGDVYDTRFDPAEGSEQSGFRPAVIVSRESLNLALSMVVVVPFTTLRSGRVTYPTHAIVRAPDGGLQVDSVALCEQIRTVSKGRLRRQRGALSAQALAELDRALLIVLDLPGQVQS